MPSADQRIHRDVVSYVRRSARMNPSQTRAWETLHDRWTLTLPAGPRVTSVAGHARIDLPQVFGRTAPLLVEIGSGNGEAVVTLAQRFPEANLLAFEVFEPAAASTLSRIERAGVTNVRLVVADGSQAVATALEDASITELWTFFPDPWHKARHHKRRLVNPDFAAVVGRKLVPGGRWRIATDWADYADHAQQVLDAEPSLANFCDGAAPRWEPRPVTRYEARGIAAGRPIIDLCYVRA
ncbi:MAG: tRNA (guanosine(46)-N7)-methyltransferase TrmB [Propionicimonas sp.]|uniref:tRNA (guanosine(46)-N7)-methyltransferase TrmB n=1 Tax=Propionicimonas sp. TaxID=1955623 RepID=UPI002B20451A|nr:tRNA (guanosine(46)-N7)-methyltransferase TrmB [Propionicimonas sp.]MEA4943268.1 tRNA (guanosine(46)-N7)-methyltransferase TrmB [Propionicimonas sp.]MEA5054022.1 tRNA (guanosine(46)-N7)-methyltransferase TrmB [Propionicimonas sp.]